MSLVTIPGIPILEVGMEWPAASGPATVTFADLEAIVSSQEDSEISGARLKIGHWDQPDGLVFASEPSLGTFTNYSIVNGITLYADLVGCPQWFTEIMPTCFPNRSIEGYQQFKTQRGKTYHMILTAVSLLGVEPQAITSLPDLYEFMNAEEPPVVVTAGGRRMAGVSARTNIEDVRRAFYEDFATEDKYWWWIRAVELDPENQLIVDDDNGQLYRIPFSLGGDEGITFSDPITVSIEYNDVSAKAVFASADYSRPAGRVKANDQKEDSVGDTDDLGATGTSAPASEGQEGGVTVNVTPPPTPAPPDTGDQPKPDDEDDDDKAKAEEKDDQPVAASKLPPGVVVLDEDTYRQLKAGASAGAEVKAKLDRQDKDALLDGAIQAGKFPPARRDHYSAMYDADPTGTRDLIEKVLESGTIPVAARGTVGQQADQQFGGGAAYDSGWLTEQERREIAAAKGA